MSRQPVVVIVGRPNVGKSTLFNRLTRSRRALVHDLPGVTRDRIVGDAELPGRGFCTLVDTGGLLLDDTQGYLPLIRSQAETALADANAVLFLLDGDTGPIPEDEEIARFLRNFSSPVVLVVNKADRRDVAAQAPEFHRLGLGDPVVISAEHGMGVAELQEALEERLGDAWEEAPGEDEERLADGIQITIIGRPNVGKSSLLNRLVGEPRVLVSEVPGTTRDAIDVIIERDGQRYRFIDTAGIRRKGKTDRGPEVLSVVLARRYLERAELCLLLIDATEGVARQDARVGGYAWEAGRAVAVVVNKWDLITERAAARRRLEEQIEDQLKFVRHAPQLFLSARTGQGVDRLFPALHALHQGYRVTVSTSDLNRIVRPAWDSRPPGGVGRREPKLFYCTQVGTAPPAFVLFTNLAQKPHFSYLRYLENVLREALGLAGVPIRVMIRGRER